MRVRTDAASEQDTTKAKTNEPVEDVEDQANEPQDTDKTADAQDGGEAGAATPDDVDAGETADGAKQAKQAKTTEPVEDVEDQANEPQDTDKTAVTQDAGEAEAATPDDVDADETADGAKQATTKRRIRSRRPRTRGERGRRGGQDLSAPVRGVAEPRSGEADQADREDESVQSEAEDSSDAAATAVTQDAGEAEAATPDDVDADETADGAEPALTRRRISRSRVVAYGVLPGLALSLALAAGYLKWQDSSARESQTARVESLAAAKDSTIALLSYKSNTVQKDLEAAKFRLTGTFKEAYSQLIKDVVIPGAERGHVSTTATVPAGCSVSASPSHAVTLLFVNQTAVIDNSSPSDTASSVRVTLDKIAGRWLISAFDPV